MQQTANSNCAAWLNLFRKHEAQSTAAILSVEKSFPSPAPLKVTGCLHPKPIRWPAGHGYSVTVWLCVRITNLDVVPIYTLRGATAKVVDS
jgi:hypothetical protein